MAFGIVHHFPGGSKENYDATIAVVHPQDGLPAGQTLHVAGPTQDGGWVVVALWDSEESFDRFESETLVPAFQQLGDSGLPGPPRETRFEIDNVQQG